MAGTIYAVHVAAGDKVTAGQVVIILESMKMEIPIETETAGKVSTIHVQPGDFVNEFDVLVTLEV